MKLEINPDSTVKEIIKTHPECREIFIKYGMGNCNHGHGLEGPEKPIWYFSQNHDVPLDQLITELLASIQFARDNTSVKSK